MKKFVLNAFFIKKKLLGKDPPLYPHFMSTFRNGQICYLKISKKKFWRTLVQGGGGVNLKAYRCVQGGRWCPKSGNSERTYFMDAPQQQNEFEENAWCGFHLQQTVQVASVAYRIVGCLTMNLPTQQRTNTSRTPNHRWKQTNSPQQHAGGGERNLSQLY